MITSQVNWKQMMRIGWVSFLTIFMLWSYLSLKLSLEIERQQRPRAKDSGYLLPGSDVIRSSALNYATAAADVLWVSAVLYAGNSYRMRRSARDVTPYADAIIDMDPLFYKVYWWHSGARMHINNYPSTEDIDEANRILKRGIEYFPDDWLLPQLIVGNFIGYSQEVDPETRLRQLEEAAYYAQKSAKSPSAPEDMTLVATAFHRKVARMRAGHMENEDVFAEATPEEIEFLIRLYYDTRSEDLRRFLEFRLSEVGAEQELLAQTNAWHVQFREYFSREQAYLSPELYTLISRSVYASSHFVD